ncbi:potassium transporter Kup [Croceibacterium sp. LX-88]|jgi:KUP system potassium uptake protein|uniref:Probable potassium transport system protein Kup n=1 Tax=Croceibacterium selenioxidans TaxID=2838833 RepID=A0ABS5W313_9SPHN|nr:potassium transporter Kup [Croceibacterium selenioxidans]MBT2134084.1 potassium transporter Kup [Croceibacterium selenioxidans]
MTDVSNSHHSDSSKAGLAKLAVGAVGVVFGDIGTSPLYAMKETFVGHHRLAVDLVHVFGVVSVMFWSLVILVTGKYVFLTLRADNKGEGGSLALLALIQRKTGSGGRWSNGLVLLGIFATALFLGDCMITPAISVLSAVEGLTVVQSHFAPYVLPAAAGILIGLFLIQKRGTDRVGKLFGPVMIVYFATLAVLGVSSIVHRPDVLQALNPVWIYHFFANDPYRAFLALGSAVLALTGAEALYADIGHFGRKPIQLAWLYLIFPALLLNYLGQGSLLLRNPAAAENPFFLLAPEDLRLPLVLLATAATVIASQAVITGAYSVMQQAVQLGVMPRLRISHTSASAHGQIYIPVVNWSLMLLVILLVVSFGESSNLAAAYGIAVTGTMICTTIMLTVLVRRVWNWPLPLVIGVISVFFLLDGAYFAANLTKIPDGGWFPLLVGAITFTMLTTWAKGRRLMRERMSEVGLPLDIFAKSARNSTAKVPGTAIFMNSGSHGTPSALLHNIKHNKVLHDRVVVLTVQIADVPYVQPQNRYEIHDMRDGFYRVVLHYGFMEETDIPAALKEMEMCGGKFEMMQTSFFLSRQTLLSADKPGMAIWREKLFAWMMRNAATPMEFFRLPTNRVVELGSQVEI